MTKITVFVLRIFRLRCICELITQCLNIFSIKFHVLFSCITNLGPVEAWWEFCIIGIANDRDHISKRPTISGKNSRKFPLRPRSEFGFPSWRNHRLQLSFDHVATVLVYYLCWYLAVCDICHDPPRQRLLHSQNLPHRHLNGRAAISKSSHRAVWSSFYPDGNRAEYRPAGNFRLGTLSVSFWRFVPWICWYVKPKRWACSF